MAQVVKLNETARKVIIYRFIGSTSRSTNIMSLLQSLCLQISNEFGIEDPKTLGRDEKAWSDMNGLADIFRKCLALAKQEKPLLLFIDSLDQLSDTDNAKALYWLPKELPEHVSLVISTLPELMSLSQEYGKITFWRLGVVPNVRYFYRLVAISLPNPAA